LSKSILSFSSKMQNRLTPTYSTSGKNDVTGPKARLL